MIKLLILITVILLAFTSTAYADCLATIDQLKLTNSIRLINDYYGDVSSRAKCGSKKLASEKLICSNKLLQAMELFDAKSEIYNYENATKTEVDHKVSMQNFLISKAKKQCKSANC